MKLIFIPDPQVHSLKVRFPILFVVSERLSVAHDVHFSDVPQVMVHANGSSEAQLPVGAYLQVSCNVGQSGAVTKAIKSALLACNDNFERYEVEARYEITPLTDEERREIAREKERVESFDAHPSD